MQRGSIAAVRRFSIRSRRRPNFRWNDSYELIIFTVCQPCCYTVLLRVYYALYRRLVSRPWSLRSWIYYDEIDSSDPSLYRIDIEFEARRFRSNIISSSKQIIGMLKFAWKKDDFYRMRINLSRLGYRKRVVNSSRRKDCQLGDQKRGDYWNSTPRLRLKFLFSMHNVYKSLACLLLIPVQNFFQNQHLAEFQDPSIKRRAITNGIICRPRIRLESYLRSTAYFSFGPPSLVIVQTEINTPRSLGACSHLRNCIPTRHIVKLSFLSFSLLWEWGRRRGEGGETKSHSDVCNEHAWMRAEGAPLSPTWKKKEWKKGEKRKRKKKGDPWREREREGELIETGHGRIPSNGSQ